MNRPTTGGAHSATGGRVSYDVRIWSIRRYVGKKATTYNVRWSVDDNVSSKTFASRRLAESFRAKLLMAARDGVAFDVASSLPLSMARQLNKRSWYEHACAFVDMKWPHVSPNQRKSIAESLTTVTVALLASDRGAPDPAILRRALRTWAFNTPARDNAPPADTRRAIGWVAANTLDINDLADPAVTRRALDALALTLAGKKAAANTVYRKRAVFYGSLRYAVELGLLDSNPIDRVRWNPPRKTEAVDRRVVINPNQARRLLDAVRDIAPWLAAFYGVLYYAALRPSEAAHLRADDCHLPDGDGWGELLLTGGTPEVGADWTDTRQTREDKALKHRGERETRRVPAHPDLARLLRDHIDTFGTGPDGRLFVTRTGRFGRPLPAAYSNPVSSNTYTRVWQAARQRAMTTDQVTSPLARRPYDLRHAAVSTWLNAGVPAPQVAEWAGHSVAVLLRVYAKCLDGQDRAARTRIEAALRDGEAG